MHLSCARKISPATNHSLPVTSSPFPMSLPATRHQSPVTPSSDDEVLVRVDGVGKKFCRSLKKSLWYGVCDIAGELLPGRKRQRVASNELLVAGGAEEAVTSNGLRVEIHQPKAKILATRHQLLVTAPKALPDSPPVTRHSLPRRQAKLRCATASSGLCRMFRSNFAGGNAWG